MKGLGTSGFRINPDLVLDTGKKCYLSKKISQFLNLSFNFYQLRLWPENTPFEMPDFNPCQFPSTSIGRLT
jgi:hypothetical protein